MTSPARAYLERNMAALKGADISEHSRAGTNGYELQLMQLTEFRRRLKQIESIERKIEAKRGMLPDFIPWVTGVMDADRGGQDDVFVTVMLWTLDTGDLQAALPMAQYVIRHKLDTPDRYERSAATLIAEEVADNANRMLDEAPNTAPSSELLLEYVELLADSDMFDQVRAKLLKATGRALLLNGNADDDAKALEMMKRAIALHDRIGLKKEVEVLSRKLRNAADATANEEQAVKA